MNQLQMSDLRRSIAHMKTSELRYEVETLIEEMKRSCRLSLWEQIRLDTSFDSTADSAPKIERSSSRSVDETETSSRASSDGVGKSHKRGRGEENAKITRKWDQLMADASLLLPFMTNDEHGAVSRLASILLLGFLIPSSTGNEFWVSPECYPAKRSRSQQYVVDPFDFESPTDSPDSWFWRITIEERLEVSNRFHNAQECGEHDVLTNTTVAAAFYSFLTNGLTPFLAGRAAHSEQVDLIHLLAMAISPQVSIAELSDKPSARKAKILMKSLHAHFFNVHYKDRLRLVHLVADNLVLPEQDEGGLTSDNMDVPLLDGAIPHIREALRSFTLSALTPIDAHPAHVGLVRIATQTGLNVRKEWDATLNLALSPGVTDDNNNDKSMNVRSCEKRGKLLERFITRYNGSRHYADEGFSRHALFSLNSAIQKQVELLQTTDGNNAKDVLALPPCQLGSLLSAARSLFYFFLRTPSKENAIVEAAYPKVEDDQFADAVESEEEEEEKENKDAPMITEELENRKTIVESCIELLRHPEPDISTKSSALLAIAFAYGSKSYTEPFIKSVFSRVRVALEQDVRAKNMVSLSNRARGLVQVVSVASRHSSPFALSLIQYLVSKRKEDWKFEDREKDKVIATSIACVIAAVASAQPKMASKELENICSLALGEKYESCLFHVIRALLSCRLGFYFSKASAWQKSHANISTAISKTNKPWTKYKLASHAMSTGNFGISQSIYKDMLRFSSTERSFLWISVLSEVSGAEWNLSENAALGIPSSTLRLHKAFNYLSSLSALEESGSSVEFQIDFITYRLDMLDLCAALRSLVGEIRLTGALPNINTRCGLHLRNMDRSFFALASRFFQLYRSFGHCLCHQQSRTAIRTLFALCRFLGRAVAHAFPEFSTIDKTDDESSLTNTTIWPKGDAMHPMTLLVNKLESGVIQQLDENVEPLVRAAAIIECLDSIFKAPLPFPIDFTKMNPLRFVRLRLSADPANVKTLAPSPISDSFVAAPTSTSHQTLGDDYNITLSETDQVDAHPGLAYMVHISGQIPESYRNESCALPFSHILVRYTVSYDSALHRDDEVMDNNASWSPRREEEHDVEATIVSSPVLPNGRFFLALECQPIWKEGLYRLEVDLGCRDVRCGEWDLPVVDGSQTIRVQVTSAHS